MDAAHTRCASINTEYSMGPVHFFMKFVPPSMQRYNCHQNWAQYMQSNMHLYGTALHAIAAKILMFHCMKMSLKLKHFNKACEFSNLFYYLNQ